MALYRDLAAASTNNAVAAIVQDNAADDQAALYLQNDGTSYGINLANNGSGLGMFINQAGTSEGLSVYSNVGATVNQPLVTIKADDTGFDQTLFRIQQDGSGNIFSAFDDTNEVFTIQDGGNVGIGTTTASDYLLSLASTTATDHSRVINITQANDAAEDSYSIYLPNIS